MNQNLTEIKRIAEDVYKSLGSGFPEVVYDKAMQVGLRLAKIKYESQKVVELQYKGHYVGEEYPDIITHLHKGKVIVELKAISGEMGAAEEQQLKNYMKILKISIGVLINFPQPGKKVKKEGKANIDIREVSL